MSGRSSPAYCIFCSDDSSTVAIVPESIKARFAGEGEANRVEYSNSLESAHLVKTQIEINKEKIVDRIFIVYPAAITLFLYFAYTILLS